MITSVKSHSAALLNYRDVTLLICTVRIGHLLKVPRAKESYCYLLLTAAAVSNITQLASQPPVLTGSLETYFETGMDQG